MSSNGMAKVIEAVLAKHKDYVRNEDFGGVVCDECGWSVADKFPNADSALTRVGQHEAHVIAQGLAKVGYGNVADVWDEAYWTGVSDQETASGFTSNDFGIPGGHPINPSRVNPYREQALA